MASQECHTQIGPIIGAILEIKFCPDEECALLGLARFNKVLSLDMFNSHNSGCMLIMNKARASAKL